MRLLLIILLLAFVVQPAAAELNTSEILSEAAVISFGHILEYITDSAYEMVGIDSANSSTFFTNIMISETDVIGNEQVQAEKDFTSFWFILMWVAFLLVGGIGVMKEATDPNDGFGIELQSWRNTYVTILVGSALVWAFYLIAIDWLLKFEYVLSRGVFFETMDFISSATNPLSYAVLGLFKLLLITFGVYRYLVISIIVAFFLLIIACRIIPYTASIAKMILSYGMLLLFGRFILVAILLIGTGVAAGWNMEKYGIDLLPMATFVLLLLDVLVAITIIIYPIIWVFFRSPVKFIGRIRR